jgi:hypothetical protein
MAWPRSEKMWGISTSVQQGIHNANGKGEQNWHNTEVQGS